MRVLLVVMGICVALSGCAVPHNEYYPAGSGYFPQVTTQQGK